MRVGNCHKKRCERGCHGKVNKQGMHGEGCLSDQKHGKKEGPWAEDRVRGNKRTEKAEGGTCIDPELEAGADTRKTGHHKRAMNAKKSAWRVCGDDAILASLAPRSPKRVAGFCFCVKLTTRTKRQSRYVVAELILGSLRRQAASLLVSYSQLRPRWPISKYPGNKTQKTT